MEKSVYENLLRRYKKRKRKAVYQITNTDLQLVKYVIQNIKFL